MTNDELREFLCTRIRPRVLERYPADSAIPTVKVTLEVLREAGVPAKPWPCSLLVANQMAAAIYLRDLTEEEMAEAVEAGAHSVEALGHTRPDGAYRGHLVVLADFSDVPHLLDLSLDQANRSTWHINVGPAAVPLIEGINVTKAIYSWVGDSMVRWTPIKNPAWRATKHWKDHAITGPMAGALIREFREMETTNA